MRIIVRIMLNIIDVIIGKKKVQLFLRIMISPGSFAIPNLENNSKIAPITTIEIPMIIRTLASVSNIEPLK